VDHPPELRLPALRHREVDRKVPFPQAAARQVLGQRADHRLAALCRRRSSAALRRRG